MSCRQESVRNRRIRLTCALLVLAPLALFQQARAQTPAYRPADSGQRPAGSGTRLLPETFLRGWDPVTVFYDRDTSSGPGPAEDGAERLQLVPSWPGAWQWLDQRTLQFRPAEAWPPLARFSLTSGSAHKTLTTLMAPPSAMAPAAGSEELRPFRTFTLTFPQALPIAALRSMLRLDLVQLPGLEGAPRRAVKAFSLAQLPRGSQRDPATYALTLDEDVPEGQRLQITAALALGDEGRTLWAGALSTRTPFHLSELRCGSAQLRLTQQGEEGRSLPLACGASGEGPQLVFSADLSEVTPSALLQLVKLSPAVPDLHADTYGGRLSLRGRFVPDTLYRMQVGPAPISDRDGRALQGAAPLTAFFYLGKRSPFLRFSQGSALLELNGPRNLPLQGEGDTRADVRIHRVDPLHPGLWPWPAAPVTIDEERAPPFPGEEPPVPGLDQRGSDLKAHLRLLGSPLVSKLVELPLANRSGPSRVGLDLGPLLDAAEGGRKAGTYLVGLRRLVGSPQGAAQRSWMRVQVTDLSLTAVEERDKALLFVRSLATAAPIKGARIALEGRRTEEYRDDHGEKQTRIVAARHELTCDSEGKATLPLLAGWVEVQRVTLTAGADVLVLDPADPPPQFASNHWSAASSWLRWLGQAPPPPATDKLVGFIFTERPIYRPGETVYFKGWLRKRVSGALGAPGTLEDGAAEKEFGLEAEGPDGVSRPLKLSFTELFGFSGELADKDPPSGRWALRLYQRQGTGRAVIATRGFQVEAYRIPAFELRLSGPKLARLDGPFTVKASAKFYAGGNVSKAKITWTVTRRPTWHTPPGREGFLFASSAQFARPQQARPPEPVRRAGVLDEKGGAELATNPALDVDGTPRAYRFEATVTGPDGQEVSATTEVSALPPFVLGMKLPRLLRDEKTLKPEVISVGPDGALVAGTEVRVRLLRRSWHSHLRETNFSLGKAAFITEQQDESVTETVIKSDGKKPVAVSLPIGAAGVYLVELVARDALGRVQTLSADLYASGPGAVAWQKPREGVFTLTPEKRSWQPGQTARIVIQSPFQTGQALVIAEAAGGNRYTWQRVEGGKAIAEVGVGARDVPNLPVHVVLMRGRVEPGSDQKGARRDDSRFKPQTVAATLELEVEPVENTVKVDLVHPDSARPGQTIPVEVKLTDPKGRALSGEVTLWLVDEAVLSLAKESPLEALPAFLERNGRHTSVRDTRNLTLGHLDDEEDPGGDGGDEKDSAGSKKRVVRKNFKTVPFWQATLLVPRSGKLTVQVPLSDDLTNFKVRAAAVSGLQRFGYQQTLLRVRLPVLVQPQLPRLVRMGDRFWPGGLARVVEGEGGPGKVELSLEGPVDGPVDVAPASHSVTLDVNEARSLLQPATVRSSGIAADTLTVKMAVTRTKDGAGDAFEVKIPVLPDRAVEHDASLRRLVSGRTTFRGFPETPRPGTATQSLAFSTVPGMLELLAGLDQLAEFPHGCLEQRMSQTWPVLAHGDLLRSLGMEGDRGLPTSPMVRRVLEDLAAFQDEAGLFGYWPGTPGDVRLTAAALQYLTAAKRAGMNEGAGPQAKAILALKKALRSDYTALSGWQSLDAQAAALRALAQAGEVDDAYLGAFFQQRGALDLGSLSDLLLALQQRAELFGPNLAAVREELWGRVRFKLVAGQPVFDGIAWRRSTFYDGWLDSSAASTAQALESLSGTDPQNPKLALLRDGLLAQAQPNGGFGSTWDNRRALSALARYLTVAREPAPEADLSLSVGAQPAQTVMLGSAHRLGKFKIDSAANVSADVRGAGPVMARVLYRWLPDAPGDQAASSRSGFVVERSWSPVTADGQGGSTGPEVADQHGTLRQVKPGDLFEIHARLTSEQPRAQVALVIPFAAGLELLNPELEGVRAEAKPSQADSIKPSFVQRADGELRYYFLQLPAGTHTFHFRVRAASEGSFVHPAPWAEQMYHQEIRGRGEGLRVQVVGEHEK